VTSSPVGSNGTFTTSFNQPYDFSGTHSLIAVESAGGRTVSQTLTLTGFPAPSSPAAAKPRPCRAHYAPDRTLVSHGQGSAGCDLPTTRLALTSKTF
jgi:hypothetical protein